MRCSKGYTVALGSVLLALTVALSVLENALPVLPFLPPGVKLGLANLVVLLCLFDTPWPFALFLTTAKCFLVLFTRGLFGFSLSLSGALLSFFVMMILLRFTTASVMLVSVSGATAHGLAQLIMAVMWTQNLALFGYLPVLLPAAVGMGLLIALILRLMLPPLAPVLRRLQGCWPDGATVSWQRAARPGVKIGTKHPAPTPHAMTDPIPPDRTTHTTGCK